MRQRCIRNQPGGVLEKLCAYGSTATVNDAAQMAASLLDHQASEREQYSRQQWKTTLDGRMQVEPEDDDSDESNGELVGSAEYGPSGDHEYEPEGDDDGGGDVFKAPREYKQKGQYGSGEYGHSGGAPDGSGLRAPEDDRERARLERDQRGNNAWRNGSAVSRANANQQQLSQIGSEHRS